MCTMSQTAFRLKSDFRRKFESIFRLARCVCGLARLSKLGMFSWWAILAASPKHRFVTNISPASLYSPDQRLELWPTEGSGEAHSVVQKRLGL